MIEQASGTASGKLILSGEHAVVYGHQAVAVSIDRGTTVTLRRRPGATRIERSVLRDERLRAAIATVLPAEGVGVSIETDLPVGRGMGSSAALAIALIRARAGLEGREADFGELLEDGFKVERVFHGDPSGVDHTVAALGAAVRYRASQPSPEIVPMGMPSMQLVVLDSGLTGDTRRLVEGVSARRPGIDPVLERIGSLTDELVELLEMSAPAEVVGHLLTENHGLLRDIGVSTPNLDRLVSFALRAGAHGAKLAGAGGGGVVIALVDDPTLLLLAAGKAGIPALPVHVGG